VPEITVDHVNYCRLVLFLMQNIDTVNLAVELAVKLKNLIV